MCAPVDGVLGWRVVTLPDGSRRGEDLAGRSVVVPPGRGRSRSPRWVLEFPGADRPLAVVQEYDGIRLLDGNGTVMAEIPRDHTAGTFTAGTPSCRPCATGTCSGPATRRARRRSAGSTTTPWRRFWRRP